MPKKKKHKTGMPSLTIDGKRDIIKLTCKAMGEKAFLQWLRGYEISSLRALNENVRRYKTRFFSEMYEKYLENK